MWKLSCFLLLLGCVAGQEPSNSVPKNATIAANVSLSNANSTQNVVLGDNKEIVTNVTVNKAEDSGSAENPFVPSDLVKIGDDQSLGAFKYYFVLLGVSSLSVIIVIIFKAMR